MRKEKKIVGVIPARYASSRFPGKPLALINGKPMIRWVYEGCTGVFDYLVVATDDSRIKEAVEDFGGNAVMTSTLHKSGTERCHEALEILENEQQLEFDYLINIQGDEPLINKEQLVELITYLEKEGTDIATLVTPFASNDNPSDPNSVKVVLGREMQALYFSRSPIPFIRDAGRSENNPYLKHIGLYGYRTGVLKEISSLSSTPLEESESLEQLRWLENGYLIRAGMTKFKSIGIDTPDDLIKLEKFLGGT